MKPPTLPCKSSQPSITTAITTTVSAASVSTASVSATSIPKPKATRSMSMSTPLHQPILMRKPREGSVLSSSLPVPVKDVSDSSLKNDHLDDLDESDSGDGTLLGPEEKKQLKRAANRRSAQLSRKRKKTVYRRTQQRKR